MPQPAVWLASGTLLGSTGADISPVPPAHLIDDILLVMAASRVVTETCATPSGYTLLAGPSDVTAWRTYAFWKRAASAAEGNPLLDWSAAVGEKYGQVHVIRGARAGSQSPFAAANLAGDLTDPITNPGTSSPEEDQLIVVVGIGSDNASASVTVTGTNPTPYTQRHFSTITTGADATGSFHDARRVTAGATGTVTLDHNSTMPAMGVLVAAILDPPPMYSAIDFIDPALL